MKLYFRLGTASSSLFKGACLAACVSTALVGCGKPGTLFNTSPLGPLMFARHTTDNAVRSLKKLKCQEPKADEPRPLAASCLEGRLRYNRAASGVNGVVSHLIVAIETNSDITNDAGFKKQVEISLKESIDLQRFLESVATPGETGEIIKFNPIDLNTLLPALIQSLATVAKESRAADARQRVTTICELRSLILPAFDEIDKSSFPKDCERSLLEGNTDSKTVDASKASAATQPK